MSMVWTDGVTKLQASSFNQALHSSSGLGGLRVSGCRIITAGTGAPTLANVSGCANVARNGVGSYVLGLSVTMGGAILPLITVSGGATLLHVLSWTQSGNSQIVIVICDASGNPVDTTGAVITVTIIHQQ